MESKIQTIDEYIEQYDSNIQKILKQMRKIVKQIAPDCEERMSWGMPTFYLKRNLVHFAVNKNHIGFYPGESGVRVFEEKLKGYKTSKGAIQFPLDKEIPYDLVKEITIYRTKENLE